MSLLIEGHVKRAKKAGASDEEIAEAIFVGIAMSVGASVAHSCFSMDALKEQSFGASGLKKVSED